MWCGGGRTPPPALRAPPLSGEAFGVVVPPLKRFHAQSAHFTRRTFPLLSTGPSLKTERFQRGRSCGTGGNPVRGAPARLHRHKPLAKGGSGGRRAAWKPRRPPAAFGSFPLRERNSCVRRRTKLSQVASCSSSVRRHLYASLLKTFLSRQTEPPRPCGARDEPLRPLRGHLPFQGRLCSGSLQKAPSAEGAVRGSLFRLRNREVALATLGFNQRLNPKPFREAD